MIAVNDLMIGNLVQSADNKVVTVFHLDSDSGGDRINYTSAALFFPVPITKQLMIECGFKYRNNDLDKYDEEFAEWLHLEVEGHNDFVSSEKYDSVDWWRYNIRYIHELQNVYHWDTMNKNQLSLK